MEANAQWDMVLKYYAQRGDVLAYGLYVHGYHVPILAKLAFSRHAYLMACAMEQSSRTAFVCPPRHGKTTLMRWENELWLGMETEKCFADPSHPVPSALYVMNTADQAEKECMEVQHTLEYNRRYKGMFPHVKLDRKWGVTKGHFFLHRTIPRDVPSYFVCGQFGPIQGFGFGKMTMDDGTDQGDANSPSKIEQQKQFRFGVFADRLDDAGGQVRDVSTRWLQNDTFAVLEQMPGVYTIVMPILDYWIDHPEHGIKDRALWPEVWPEKRIEGVRQEKIAEGQAGLWELTYMCRPQLAEGGLFKREWIVRGKVPDDLFIIQTVDPASGTGDRADYTVVATVGLHRPSRKFYVLDILRSRVQGPDQPGYIRDAYNAWHPAYVGIESIFYQSTLLQYMRRQGELPLREIPRRSGSDVGKKMIRLAGLAARYKEKQVLLPDTDLPWIDDYITEACAINFTNSDKGTHAHDDQVDAVSMAIDILSGSMGMQSQEPQYFPFSHR